jgi:hypothetical protein
LKTGLNKRNKESIERALIDKPSLGFEQTILAKLKPERKIYQLVSLKGKLLFLVLVFSVAILSFLFLSSEPLQLKGLPIEMNLDFHIPKLTSLSFACFALFLYVYFILHRRRFG